MTMLLQLHHLLKTTNQQSVSSISSKAIINGLDDISIHFSEPLGYLTYLGRYHKCHFFRKLIEFLFLLFGKF